MTKEHSHHTPSSIHDDSICESSLNPNKSSGDIGDRTWTPEQFWEFAAAYLGDHEATTSRTMIEDRGLVLIPVAEIERLRREVENIREMWLSSHLDRMRWRDRALTAESAVAAAYENAAKIALGEVGYIDFELMTTTEIVIRETRRSIASAIRAAGGGAKE